MPRKPRIRRCCGRLPGRSASKIVQQSRQQRLAGNVISFDLVPAPQGGCRVPDGRNRSFFTATSVANTPQPFHAEGMASISFHQITITAEYIQQIAQDSVAFVRLLNACLAPVRAHPGSGHWHLGKHGRATGWHGWLLADPALHRDVVASNRSACGRWVEQPFEGVFHRCFVRFGAVVLPVSRNWLEHDLQIEPASPRVSRWPTAGGFFQAIAGGQLVQEGQRGGFVEGRQRNGSRSLMVSLNPGARRDGVQANEPASSHLTPAHVALTWSGTS